MTFRSFLNTLKGFNNACLDKSYQIYRRIRQRVLALQRVELSGSSVHILFMSRTEYLVPVIRCLNSFWEFNPEYSAQIWLDDVTSKFKNDLLKKLDRKDRVEFRSVDEVTREWQWNKQNIIINQLNEKDIFCDADIIWNGRLPKLIKPTFFLKEFDLMSRASTRHLVKTLNIKSKIPIYMYNVSFVFLGSLAQNTKLSESSKTFYQNIRKCEADEILGQDDVPALQRMSEQIAISLAIQLNPSQQIEALKQQDSVMDGRIAESYYLGSSSGWQ